MGRPQTPELNNQVLAMMMQIMIMMTVWGGVGRMARLLLRLRVLSRSARHLARRGNIYPLLQQALIVRLGRPTTFTNVM